MNRNLAYIFLIAAFIGQLFIILGRLFVQALNSADVELAVQWIALTCFAVGLFLPSFFREVQARSQQEQEDAHRRRLLIALAPILVLSKAAVLVQFLLFDSNSIWTIPICTALYSAAMLFGGVAIGIAVKFSGDGLFRVLRWSTLGGVAGFALGAFFPTVIGPLPSLILGVALPAAGAMFLAWRTQKIVFSSAVVLIVIASTYTVLAAFVLDNPKSIWGFDTDGETLRWTPGSIEAYSLCMGTTVPGQSFWWSESGMSAIGVTDKSGRYRFDQAFTSLARKIVKPKNALVFGPGNLPQVEIAMEIGAKSIDMPDRSGVQDWAAEQNECVASLLNQLRADTDFRLHNSKLRHFLTRQASQKYDLLLFELASAGLVAGPLYLPGKYEEDLNAFSLLFDALSDRGLLVVRGTFDPASDVHEVLRRILLVRRVMDDHDITNPEHHILLAMNATDLSGDIDQLQYWLYVSARPLTVDKVTAIIDLTAKQGGPHIHYAPFRPNPDNLVTKAIQAVDLEKFFEKYQIPWAFPTDDQPRALFPRLTAYDINGTLRVTPLEKTPHYRRARIMELVVAVMAAAILFLGALTRRRSRWELPQQFRLGGFALVYGASLAPLTVMALHKSRLFAATASRPVMLAFLFAVAFALGTSLLPRLRFGDPARRLRIWTVVMLGCSLFITVFAPLLSGVGFSALMGLLAVFGLMAGAVMPFVVSRAFPTKGGGGIWLLSLAVLGFLGGTAFSAEAVVLWGYTVQYLFGLVALFAAPWLYEESEA